MASSSPNFGAGLSSGYLPPFIPTLVTLVGQIRQELESHPGKLLALNSSRREAVAQHLERLAGLPAGPTLSGGTGDAGGGLRRWIDGPRSPAQTQALRTFFDEVAWVSIGQALLLKSWADRGIRPWKPADLAGLNWALSQALKPHVPLDREGWQITKPNLYSWYNPSPKVQAEIWAQMDGWKISEDGPALLAAILKMGRPPHQSPELHGYDPRFFSSLWQSMSSFGFDPGPDQSPLRRRKVIFSPTLRDGSMVRAAPESVSWIGLEAHPFQLLVAELVQLWWGPSPPPSWAQGTGLEVHSRDQLALALGSPKPSLINRIAEMEACDLAFVLEERCVRLNARSLEAARFREQVESLPYYKRLRSAGTSLGDLQACVALSKLRPEGLLWWAREEPLGTADGAETLSFLLENGKLLFEWDFSALEHSLPVPAPLFPKYLYVFAREPRLQERMNHRPVRVALAGQIRSHIEVPVVLADALRRTSSSRSPWQVHVHASTQTQKEWGERWPDPATTSALQEIERLRTDSSPLASLCTVRPSPQGDPARGGAWSVPPTMRGLWLHIEEGEKGCRLRASDLPRPTSEARQPGFLILLSDESWTAPLCQYLESPIVHRWLEHHVDRKGAKWSLSEQVIKFIPVPKLLIEAIGPGQSGSDSTGTRPLPGDWERIAAEAAYQPRHVAERLATLPNDGEGRRIRASIFVRAAQGLEQLRSSQSRLFSMVRPDGQIDWKELMAVLPRPECVAIPLHPGIRMTGSLPPHLPIGRMDRVRAPAQGILLATESGFNLRLESDSPRLLEMLWAQLQGLAHPTWSELTQYLRLPRQVELADSTAAEVLLSHGEQCGRLQQLQSLIATCLAAWA